MASVVAAWPAVALGEVLRKSEDWVDIEPNREYAQVTIRLWGRGVALRSNVQGAEIAAARQLAVHQNEFILSRIDARNGAFGLVPPELDGAVVSNDFPAFRLDESRLCPAFLAWMSKTHAFVEECKRASEGATNRVRLQESRFLGMEVPLPPLEEQRRIVARIDELAARVEVARGLRREARADARGMLMQAYSTITDQAPLALFSDVAPLQRRPVPVDIESNYPELGIRSFGKGTFHKPALPGASVGTKRLFAIRPGDLLFNIVFAWEGAVAVARPEDDGRVGSHRFLTCVPDEGVAKSEYLCFHFLTAQGLEQLGAASPGGAGRNRTLGLKALEAIQVPLPSLDKQVWFEGLIRQVRLLNEMQESADALVDALLPSILDTAFRGDL